jgi:hypothetical protein
MDMPCLLPDCCVADCGLQAGIVLASLAAVAVLVAGLLFVSGRQLSSVRSELMHRLLSTEEEGRSLGGGGGLKCHARLPTAMILVTEDLSQEAQSAHSVQSRCSRAPGSSRPQSCSLSA